MQRCRGLRGCGLLLAASAASLLLLSSRWGVHVPIALPLRLLSASLAAAQVEKPAVVDSRSTLPAVVGIGEGTRLRPTGSGLIAGSVRSTAVPPPPTNATRLAPPAASAFPAATRLGVLSTGVAQRTSSVDRVPSIVHFAFHPIVSRLSVWTYLSVVSARLKIAPRAIRWHHRGALPTGPWWDCAREHVTPHALRNLTAPEAALGISHAFDALRLEVLLEAGGIFMDTDYFALGDFAAERSLAVPTLGLQQGGDSLAGSFVVSPPNATFVRAWLDSFKTFNPKKWDEHCCVIPFKLAKSAPADVHVLPREAFMLRDWRQGESMFGSDDCVNWNDARAIHGMYPERRRSPSLSWLEWKKPGFVRPTNMEGIDDVWAGNGSAHRAARVLLREAAQAGVLCPAAAAAVARLATAPLSAKPCFPDSLQSSPVLPVDPTCANTSFVRDVDVNGGLASLRATDAASCCAACVAEVQCGAWVWRGGDCWLKGAGEDSSKRPVGSGLLAGSVRA